MNILKNHPKLADGIAAACALLVIGSSLTGCGGGAEQAKEITVISREDGSGTRGAFTELFGIEEEQNGEKIDMTTDASSVTNSTSVMMTSVAGNENAIGYISMGSLNSSVKALRVDGAEASADGVKDGSYKVSRPFNIVTKDSLSETARDFIDFIMSAEGQAVVEENGYISEGSSGSYSGSKPAGKIVVSGSSSVTPIMEKLKEAYIEINPSAEIEVQQSDSTTGINNAIDGVCDIGMASRELKESETQKGVKAAVIALDGIAVIVNNSNPINEITSEQIRKIYTGEITDWSEIGEQL